MRLSQGEAVFSPAPVTAQERRPFTVQAPGAALTARGTRYVVGVGDEREGWLGVLQHSVEVQLDQRGLDDMAGTAVVEQGSSLSFGPHQGLVPLEIGPEELASWQQGRLVLRREPLAQAFKRGDGPTFVVVANHFKSKGSCPEQGRDADQRDGQDCWNPARTLAARALAADLPAAELVIAPDAGHMPHRLRTDLVIAAIRRVNEMTSAAAAD